MSKSKMRTWVEIDTKALGKNVATLKKKLPMKTKFMAVVKSDAYGHGMIPVAKVALKSGADQLAVFDIEEAILLRKNKIKAPILILREIGIENISKAIKLDLEVSISTFEILKYLSKVKLSKPLRVHIVIDTGLGRDGFGTKDIHEIVKHVKGSKNVKVVGLMTHFSGAESREFDQYTKMQADWLIQCARHFKEVGINPILHASATAGIFLSKDFCLDMVRFGIGIYGLWPSKETRELDNRKTKLIPILEWKTIVQEVKELSAGSYIGYDLTHELEKDSVVAVLPIGYADGYSRSASNVGSVLIRGKQAPILGRVMMNMFVVDVTGIKNVKAGDIVTLIGNDGNVSIEADDIAEVTGSINYEIVTRIHPSVPRIYR